MITGYNTDIRHGELVFHVQTEDKGVKNPFIESLVYVGGQILAAKRSNYADILEEGLGDKAIAERMDHQHRVVIRAIKTGKFDQKVAEQLGVEIKTEPAPGSGARSTGILDLARDESAPSLDQVILDYLTSEARDEQLVLAFDSDPKLNGLASVLELRATSSRSGDPVAGAQVTVRMISTTSEPRFLGKGTTDDAGYLRMEVDISQEPDGAAALIIAAASSIGRAELKHLLV